MEDLNDIFREEEDRLLAEARTAIAAENAAWYALTQEERDAITEARLARFPDLPEADEGDEDEDEDEEY